MNLTVADRLSMREYARGIQDVNLERACNADLVRLGYRDSAPRTDDPVIEAAVPVPTLERAVPERPKPGRKPLPRCKHNKIAGRCRACEKEQNDG